METYAIEVHGLVKTYSKIKAIDNIDFNVKDGEVFGFLGPNGAGKTTTIKILMTLATPTAGELKICGTNIRKYPTETRQMLGYVPQELSVDGDLTGYENLLIYAKLCFVNSKDREKRIRSALEYMGLQDRANDLTKHYSGGMMRRLEIAQALVHRPKVLFLDEPSIGLDPAARRQVWDYIKDINKRLQTTIFITTHDMLEADVLCDRIAIIDAGKLVITGTPTELKKTIGGDFIQFIVQKPTGCTDVLPLINCPPSLGTVIFQSDPTHGNPKDLMDNQQMITIHSENGTVALPQIIQNLINSGLTIISTNISQPTLDDVFLKYTHNRLKDSKGVLNSRNTRRSFKSHAK